MIKSYLMLILLLVTVNIFSQEIYFTSGKNYTKYIYKDANLQVNSNLQSGTGNFYEAGYTNASTSKRMLYSFGLSLNEYNAVGGNTTNSYRWDTQYLGVHGGLSFKFFTIQSNQKNDIDFLVKTGLNAATIIYGKQQVNGIYYDLMNQKEFSGIILESSLGLTVRYGIPSFGGLSIGYDFCQSLNLTNSSKEKLSFNTNQLELGIHFNIN
ncbi:hypothetical protein SLW70_11030 [Flavobacterium sp. NG2]|uniref:hypothetical protein n=1 Tax=Flavobacterium sp. NG2 TaxID=3097547 RepID=UPI002A80E8DD|nr:hypothetical protein [Flavobacterium sp. NG2]WPR70476.1 hypothetical protein SLW70_11030 [Flavobacterium sp. NG2]